MSIDIWLARTLCDGATEGNTRARRIYIVAAIWCDRTSAAWGLEQADMSFGDAVAVVGRQHGLGCLLRIT